MSLKRISSALLIGKNGVGKSTIASALEVFQRVGRGINRVGELVTPKDFAFGRSQIPIRFELEILLQDKLYQYNLAFELPEGFKELRILEERLFVEGNPVYDRKAAQVTLISRNREAQFLVDWHLVALPIIQEQSDTDPLRIFKLWLARMLILSPIPALMTGESSRKTLAPEKNLANFGEWFSGLLSYYPAAYTQIDRYLIEVIPDIEDILNESIGKDANNMVVRFATNNMTLSIDFKDLSSGEKCFFLCAVVLAANKYYGPLLCFWDEPGSHLSLSEIGHLMIALRRSFKDHGQIIVTSHHEEAIRKFADENSFVLDRKSHLEPTVIRLLTDVPISGDLVGTLIRGDIQL